MKRIFLTYDNLSLQDGFGAQLQRIFGIYSICKRFKFNYVHSAITATKEELAHNVQSVEELEKILIEVNAKFVFPSSNLPKQYNEITVRNISRRSLIQFVIKSYIKRQNLLLKICLPYGVIDKYPDWYEFAGNQLRNSEFIKSTKLKHRVVVHVRHGYKPIEGKNRGSTPRFLPLSYYPIALDELFKKEVLDINTPVLVHTDLPISNGTWQPIQAEKIAELSGIGYEFLDHKLEFKTIDLKQEYFAKYPNLVVRYSAPILDTLEDMCSSQFLLISRSSFSYIAGVINPGTVYIPRLHGHAKMSRWKWDFNEAAIPKIDLMSGI
jgi:hypothetical protein